MNTKSSLLQGKTYLGIELGSTRIKALLIDEEYHTIATGSCQWVNQLVDGLWTYRLEDIWTGIQQCYQSLTKDVLEQYGVTLSRIGAIGISAMMHGYMVFDEDSRLLVPFRTWRNTNTQQAAERLTDLFQFNIPQRWSISHLYQAILNQESHRNNIRFMTTLAGYIHWKLTGEKVLGICDASGMFPIDTKTRQFDQQKLDQFQDFVDDEQLQWKIRDILPKVLSAGEYAGKLTAEGAQLLDVSGHLQAGIPLCPPEGDAATGMVATNSVMIKTGNVSAGTSIFSMIVMEKNLQKFHKEIDIVTTPTGLPVAMVHCNNCTSDLNAWASIFHEFACKCGASISTDQLYSILFGSAKSADPDCGGLMGYNYMSGEPIMGFQQGCPIFLRTADSAFTLSNFMKMQLYSALASLKYGLDILLKEEQVELENVFGHGGFFKTSDIGQCMLSAAIGRPVNVTETAGEGGPWGAAVLAAYLIEQTEDQSFESYLTEKVFSNQRYQTITASMDQIDDFNNFIERYQNCLPVEKMANDCMQKIVV